MELSELTGKVYYEVRFEDVPPCVQLGGRCSVCGHEAPLDTEKLKRRSGEAYIRFAARFVRCTKCGNGDLNRIFVAGNPQR